MKRFFATVFAILFLCQDVSASQSKTDTNGESNPQVPVAEEQQPADESPYPNQESTSVNDKPITGDLGIPLIERVKQFATKTNLALLVSVLSAIFAGLSWLVSNRGVRVTEKTAKAEYQPYITAGDDGFHISSYIPDQSNTAINFVGVFVIKNVGRIPANNVKVSARIKYYSQGYHFDENGIITNWRFDDLYPEERRAFKLNYTLNFPNGNANHFTKIQEMDIFITVDFGDAFTEKRSYLLHFLIYNLTNGAELQGVKEQ